MIRQILDVVVGIQCSINSLLKYENCVKGLCIILIVIALFLSLVKYLVDINHEELEINHRTLKQQQKEITVIDKS